MRAHIEAYGCALNRGEALEFESVLRSGGWEITSDPEQADLNAIATCVVIETTEREMIKRIKQLSSLGKPLVVTGCMVTALKNKIETIAPDARLVPPSNLSGLCESAGVEEKYSWAPNPWPGTFCYTIPIASGCLGNCAYCITRSARGDIKSRGIEAIIDGISRIDFSLGTKEIQLTAQDTAAYGRDIGSPLPELIRRLTNTERNMKIRIGMMNPKSVLPILDELLEVYSSDKIFKFLHLPVQSASDRILTDMNRGHTAEDFRTIVRKFREMYPDITLSTDLIVGYPGETEDDHLLNMALIEDIRPDIVNITRFSPRPGTKASILSGRVPGWRAKNRSRELTRKRFDVSLEKNRKKIGRVIPVIVTEKGTDGTMISRSENYEQIIIEEGISLGASATVKINDCSPIHLKGMISQGP
ncbi:MAG: tRNA (N(6)-L-threonylcarbamoyladenosine(37)-C(2))-methylthiotransferase [Thermoplasmata archaeon]|nr:tRNA (N(6)-L-threonylcarbamoyladenosine(37)-C(2))-methylthiotransferase [Thermoplasmata archaeon]